MSTNQAYEWSTHAQLVKRSAHLLVVVPTDILFELQLADIYASLSCVEVAFNVMMNRFLVYRVQACTTRTSSTL